MGRMCWQFQDVQTCRTIHQQGVTLDASRFSGQCRAGSAGAGADLNGAWGSRGLGGWHLVLCAPIC